MFNQGLGSPSAGILLGLGAGIALALTLDNIAIGIGVGLIFITSALLRKGPEKDQKE